MFGKVVHKMNEREKLSDNGWGEKVFGEKTEARSVLHSAQFDHLHSLATLNTAQFDHLHNAQIDYQHS